MQTKDGNAIIGQCLVVLHDILRAMLKFANLQLVIIFTQRLKVKSMQHQMFPEMFFFSRFLLFNRLKRNLFIALILN